MPFLEIVYLNGDVDRKPLEKQQPVSIGSHSSNDIRIDEEGVETLHCRVAWNKKAFEAVAAGTEGFEVNGNVVQRAVLKQGDVLRFGTVDLKFFEHEEQGAELPLVAAMASPDSGSMQLKPLTDDYEPSEADQAAVQAVIAKTEEVIAEYQARNAEAEAMLRAAKAVAAIKDAATANTLRGMRES